MTSATGGRRFRPGLWPSLLTLIALGLLVGLGTWQLDRRAWKEGLIDKLESRLEAPPVALEEAIADPKATEFRRVHLTGTYLHDRELIMEARTYNGRVGADIVTPLRLADGQAILVDRGWVPPGRKTASTRADGLVEGTVTILAQVRQGGWTGSALFRPDNDPESNEWLWFDLPAMADAAALEDPVTAIYARALEGVHPGRYQIPSAAEIRLRNQHLEYAITWYGLAVVLAVIYIIFGYRRDRPGTPGESE